MSEAPSPIRIADDRVLVSVWVIPGAKRPGFDGLHDGSVRLRVAAPPEGGKANREAASRVAEACGGRRGEVVKGGGSRRKVVAITGTTAAKAAAGLRELGVAL